MVDRVPFLQKMVEAKPEDPFPRYGLAMEYKTRGMQREAEAEFEGLLEAFPRYVPAFLMFGNLLADGGDTARARGIYERGMGVAREAGDDHALGELEAAHAELP
ncbi:MAG: tetratricopeptide repeat protein [Nannocystaceae bacterium]